MTPTEYDVLNALIAHPNNVLTDRMLLQQVWGSATSTPGVGNTYSALESVIYRAVRRDPLERYQSMAELRHDLVRAEFAHRDFPPH